MRKIIDEEWVECSPSELALVGYCPCGEIALYTHWKDAAYSSVLPCSDACKSIEDTRNSWFEIYGQENKNE